jgi:hypothetical protein
MEAEIKNIEFCNTNGYADKVKDVLAKYDVQMSDTELIKIMASRVQSQVYVQMIIKHLETTRCMAYLASLALQCGLHCRAVGDISGLDGNADSIRSSL